jgi:hypothetical protein
MATTYYGDSYHYPFPVVDNAASQVVVPFAFTIVTALIINDLVKFTSLPAMTGIYLLDWQVVFPDVDTGGTPTWDFDLGDNTTADKFLAANTTGQAAGEVNSYTDGVAGALPCSYVANNDFVLKVHTAPQVGATAVKIYGKLTYTFVGTGGKLF